VNTSYRNDRHTQDLLEPEEREREISLGTATVLGIFFVLALICAVFFGFGYSMGRKSAQSVVAAPADAAVEADGGSSSKPAPGSPAKVAGSHSGEEQAETAAPAAESNDSGSSAPVKTAVAPAVVVAKPSAAASQPVALPQTPAAAPAVRQVSLGRPAAAPAAVAPAPVAVPGVGTILVQVAAVSHQEDANMLVNALKKRGYTVAIRQVPQDKLLHIQLGPFATKKDADAMKQRLLADGYNAIVK
jgi:DedD protein